MTTRICLACKEDVKGFVFCPKCGGQTEIIESQEVKTNSMEINSEVTS
jgi:rRNA maturation endonuclease Nob1